MSPVACMGQSENYRGIEASIRSAKLPYGIKIDKVRVEDGETLLVWPEDSESLIVKRSAQKRNIVSKTLAFHTLKYSLPDVVIKGKIIRVEGRDM